MYEYYQGELRGKMTTGGGTGLRGAEDSLAELVAGFARIQMDRAVTD
jgi:hypothetical protein